MAKRKRKRSSGSQTRIGEKIRLLRHEGKSGKEAAGMAYGMERAGRLGRHGVYHRVGRKRKRRSRRS
jgi:hypothetical protein